MKYKPYPAYKDSGVEWLGQIPAHWGVARFKRVARLLYGDSLPDEARDAGDVEVFGSNGPVGQHSTPNTKAPAIIIGRKGSYGKVNYSFRPVFAIDTTYFIDERTSTQDLRWLFYAAQLLGLDTYSEDSAIPGLSREFVYSRMLAVPPIQEQQEITRFVDRETAKIDALAPKKERLIELLQEKRAALITRAVTKGIPSTDSGQATPNVPMKDSGVQWLGQIPAHWEVMRTKFVARLESGHTPSRQHPEYWVDCTIPWFSLADVWEIREARIEYVYETIEKVSEVGLANSAARLLPKGTVMVSRTASVGFSGIMGKDMATTQDFVNWVCGPRIQPEYLLYVFRAMKPELDRLTMGSTHQTIYMPDVARFLALLPPREEQTRIVDFVRRETARIDSLVDRIRRAIDRLNDYRTALISAAVTGKIDVRDAAV